MGEVTVPRVGLVKWANPFEANPRVFWGLRINGAYLGKPGNPVVWDTRAEAMKARAAIKAPPLNPKEPTR